MKRFPETLLRVAAGEPVAIISWDEFERELRELFLAKSRTEAQVPRDYLVLEPEDDTILVPC